MIQKAHYEREQAIQEKNKLLEEKQETEQGKDQALSMANDLIARLKAQLQKVELQLAEKTEEAKTNQS